MSDTPETDAAVSDAGFPNAGYVFASFARRLERDRNMWKANHDHQVALKRILMDRPDLKDRAASMQRLIEQRDRLLASLEWALSEVNHADISLEEYRHGVHAATHPHCTTCRNYQAAKSAIADAKETQP